MNYFRLLFTGLGFLQFLATLATLSLLRVKPSDTNSGSKGNKEKWFFMYYDSLL